jgi:hypothetical protein
MAMTAQLRVVALALGFAPIACTVPKPPGELVGAYHIEGKLVENSCGAAALPASDTLSFDVEVRQDEQGRGVWRLAMPPARFGSLTPDGAFAFELQSNYRVDVSRHEPLETLSELDPEALANPDLVERLDRAGAQAPCTLVVVERIEGNLFEVLSDDAGINGGADAGEADLVGKNEIAIRAGQGSVCAPVLTTYGGPFEDLPCSARYELEGDLKGAHWPARRPLPSD